MNTIFMNSENIKTSHPYRLLLNLANKINLKRSDKYVAVSNLSIYYTINSKCRLQHRMKKLNHLKNNLSMS